MPILIQISRIQWWCSLFSFSTEKIFFEQILSKNSILSVKVEIWYLDYFESVKFDGGIHFLCFGPFFASFVEKGQFDVLMLPG